MTVKNGFQSKCHIWSLHNCVRGINVLYFYMIFRWLCRLEAIQGAEPCTPLFCDNSKVSQVKFICIAYESHSVSQKALQAPKSTSF